MSLYKLIFYFKGVESHNPDPGGIINKSFVSTKAPAFILYFLFLTTSTVWLDAPSSSIRSALAS